jgi:hypothetical protein
VDWNDRSFAGHLGLATHPSEVRACRDAWFEEAGSMQLEGRDFDVALAAELPVEAEHHAAAAALDAEFDATTAEWWDWLVKFDDLTHLLVIEQGCQEGVLLPFEFRTTRWQTAPLESLWIAQRFFDECPSHVAAHLSHQIYWVLRSERARRCGTTRWSPRSACLGGEWPRA